MKEACGQEASASPSADNCLLVPFVPHSADCHIWCTHSRLIVSLSQQMKCLLLGTPPIVEFTESSPAAVLSLQATATSQV